MCVKKRIYASVLLSSVVMTSLAAPTLATADSIDDKINQADTVISEL